MKKITSAVMAGILRFERGPDVGGGHAGGEIGPAVLRDEGGLEERELVLGRGGGVGLGGDVGSEG